MINIFNYGAYIYIVLIWLQERSKINKDWSAIEIFYKLFEEKLISYNIWN